MNNLVTSRTSKAVKYSFLFAVAVLTLIPFWVTFLGGFKTQGELRANPFALPQEWRLDVFQEILTTPNNWLWMWNSFLYTGLTVVFVLLIASMVAFTFSHIKFAGHKYIYSYLLLGMMFPAATAILPLFIKVMNLGMLDTTAGVVLPQIAFGLAMSVLFFRAFFQELPGEIFEAAMVDGCSYFRFFFTIVIPLSTPILATVGVFTLVQSWNNYIMPLIMINSTDNYTWTLGIVQYRGQYNVAWEKMLGYVTFTITPAIVFFLLAQRYIVAGLSQGAVKG